MSNDKDILQSFSAYLSFFPEEEGKFTLLMEQVKSGEDIYNRSNMTGHVTASGLVVNQQKEFCLIYHNFLQRYLQPGGHVDPEDAMITGAALREVTEETGLLDVHLMQWCAEHGMPMDIDSHDIPERPEKGEGVHVHHDFLYLFESFDNNTILQTEEVSDLKWVSLQELAAEGSRFARIVEKIDMHGIYAV